MKRLRLACYLFVILTIATPARAQFFGTSVINSGADTDTSQDAFVSVVIEPGATIEHLGVHVV